MEMNSKLILAGMAAAMLITAPVGAKAADLAPLRYKAPLYEGPVYANWTGFYLGLNGGYVWGSSQWSGGAGSFKVSPDGWLMGGTLGYNLQTGVWVWGIEGDIDYANLKGTDTAVCGGCEIKDTWFGTLRGRLGYSLNNWLPFVTGGLAAGDVHASTPGGAVSRTKTGWTVGGGLEYAFLGHWSAKAEYLYADLGSSTCDYTTCILPSDASADFTANIVRAGINYRF